MDVLQFVSTIASAVLAFLCLYLSMKKNVHFFIVVGQEVFKWISAVLICITVTRLFVYSAVLSNDLARPINGAVYILSIAGILWSVGRHARRK